MNFSLNMNRIRRRLSIIAQVWRALRKVDVAQRDADFSEGELERAKAAEKRAADRATQADKVHAVSTSAAAAQEAKLASFNPFSGVSERS